VVHTFELTPSNAAQYGDSWTWDLSLDVDFEAGQSQQFAVDLSRISGPKGDRNVGLTDHYRVQVGLDSSNRITGFVECANPDDEKNPTCSSASKCNPSLGVQKFNVINGDVAQKIKVSISFDSNSGLCELGDAVLGWLELVLIIIGVGFCLCILIVVLGCMGLVSCCCFRKPQTTKVIRLEPTNAGRQQQPGVPDLTPYNAGLQPGWEAQWDANSQNVFWVNHNTQTSSWVDPRVTSGV